MHPDWLPKALMVQYVVAALVYGWSGDWPRCYYWIGATIITGSVLWMR